MSRLHAFARALALCTTCAVTAAVATPLAPVSYSMPNGDGQASGGSYNYWDRNYTGIGAPTIDGSPLANGLGKLTDGVVSTSPWNTVSNVQGTGQYVGWIYGATPNPSITFSFASSVTINEVDIALDNTQFGGVFAPSAILIDGVSRAFTAPPAGSVGVVSFTGLQLQGSTHTVQLDQAGNDWVFVSEISFVGTAAGVPEPAPLALLVVGAAGAVAMRRRTRR